MQAMSDDGEDDSEVTGNPKAREATAQKSKREREAELRRMMEESDEEPEEKADTPMEEAPEEPDPEPEPEPEAEAEPVKEGPPEIISASGDGRRRGKRRIMKKKQIMDEQGYLGKRIKDFGGRPVCSPG